MAGPMRPGWDKLAQNPAMDGNGLSQLHRLDLCDQRYVAHRELRVFRGRNCSGRVHHHAKRHRKRARPGCDRRDESVRLRDRFRRSKPCGGSADLHAQLLFTFRRRGFSILYRSWELFGSADHSD